MTAKELQHLARLHRRLTTGCFDETDVSAMLVIVRNYVGEGPVKELSHNIAHNDRDRGRFFERILANKMLLNDPTATIGSLQYLDVFSIDEFGTQLNTALTRYELSQLGPATIELVMLCILSLLQGGTFQKNKLASLHLSADAERIVLNAMFTSPRIAFPILSVPNRWLSIDESQPSVWPRSLVEVTVRDGQPRIDGFGLSARDDRR